MMHQRSAEGGDNVTPRIKAAVLVRQDSRFLLVQEKGPPMHGFWNWPQGRVEEGESVEEAAVREAKEETGLDIKIEKTVAVLEDTFPDIKELHVYLATIVGGEMTLPDDEIPQHGSSLLPKWKR